MSHAHTATTDSRLSPHRAYTFQCVTCIQCHLSRAYDTTQLPVAWYRWTGQHIHTCHVFMDSPLSIHTIIFLSPVARYRWTGNHFEICHVLILPRHRLTSISTQERYFQTVVCTYCRLSHSHMSHAHTATPQTHVYVHTGDILERVICIYCHLSHAYDTTILPVALDM